MSASPLVTALGRLVGSFYADHVRLKLTRIPVRGWWVACACSSDKPDPACDVGEALFRVRAAENRRYDDGRRPR